MKRGYYRNGRMYKSKTAYLRQVRAMFANLNHSQKRSFKPVVVDSARINKKPVIIHGDNFKDVSARIETRTILKPVENKQTKQINLKTEKQTYRVNSANIDDPVAGTTTVVEVEEASRYTPAELEYTYEEIGGGVTQVNAIKDKRIVKSTVTSQKPSFALEEDKFSLQQRFSTWDKTKDEDDRLSVAELKLLGKQLDIPVGGGKLKHPRATYEKRIRAKLQEQKTQSKQLNITRNFPQTTARNKRFKAKKYDNQDELNQILATEMANERIYPAKKKVVSKSAQGLQEEMEDLLKGAEKNRPDSKYNPTQLQKAVNVEKEHTTNTNVAKVIAKDHLDEDPKYYTKLQKVEATQTHKSYSKEDYKQLALTLPKNFTNSNDRRKGYEFVINNEKRLKALLPEHQSTIDFITRQDNITFRNQHSLDSIRKALWRKYYNS